MPEAFRVAGLAATRVGPEHLDGLVGLDSDPQVMASLGGPRPREVTEAHLGYDMEQWEREGFGMYALVAEGGDVIGRAGFRSTVLAGVEEVEVGYSLLTGWWGRGIATAAVDQIIGLAGLTELALSIAATVGPANRASLRVLEKAGFVYERQLVRAGETMGLYRRVLPPGPWGEGPGVVTADGCPVEVYAALPADGRAKLVDDRIRAGSSVLDLGCGTGRIAEPLAALGHRVVGVDNSPEMLVHLRAAQPVKADIATLDLGDRFDAVILASNLVNHPDPATRQALLDVAAAHFTPSGVLLVERQPPSWFEQCHAGHTNTATIGEVTTILNVHARLGDLVSATVTYGLRGRRWSQHFTTRWLTDDDLRRALADAGLDLQGLFGPDGTWAAAMHARPR
ncbi:MAG: GNAT family N-acetyltransferase [Actinomycetota bacterium]|jgi:RimJ/RimL family protein N-acetyltransferase|nr:GNAT family N-acetyltransferase [Actinomycetota bacterium]